MARVGILGYPNVGKTTIFNALTGLEALTAAHPFATIEPNVGVARVPDERLESAAAAEGCQKTVFATLDLLDLPAMARPGKGGGLGAQFIGRLREMEALAVVVRAFEDEAVLAEDAGTDPIIQAEELGFELTLADAEVFGPRSEKAAKEATADPTKKRAADAIRRAADVLEEGRPLRAEEWTDEERGAFRDLAPLTLKPTVWVINVGEDAANAEELRAAVTEIVPAGDVIVALSAQIEEEAARLDPEERTELFEGLGLGEGVLATVVGATYEAAGLLLFYTLAPKEAHAWTVRQGTTAREAAGKIHSDLQRGFIRAEVCSIGDVISAGGWDAAKAAGAVRLEGRDYVVCDQDVILVRFSV